jgi:hypothetical protein
LLVHSPLLLGSLLGNTIPILPLSDQLLLIRLLAPLLKDLLLLRLPVLVLDPDLLDALLLSLLPFGISLMHLSRPLKASLALGLLLVSPTLLKDLILMDHVGLLLLLNAMVTTLPRLNLLLSLVVGFAFFDAFRTIFIPTFSPSLC